MSLGFLASNGPAAVQPTSPDWSLRSSDVRNIDSDIVNGQDVGRTLIGEGLAVNTGAA